MFLFSVLFFIMLHVQDSVLFPFWKMTFLSQEQDVLHLPFCVSFWILLHFCPNDDCHPIKRLQCLALPLVNHAKLLEPKSKYIWDSRLLLKACAAHFTRPPHNTVWIICKSRWPVLCGWALPIQMRKWWEFSWVMADSSADNCGADKCFHANTPNSTCELEHTGGGGGA